MQPAPTQTEAVHDHSHHPDHSHAPGHSRLPSGLFEISPILSSVWVRLVASFVASSLLWLAVAWALVRDV